MVGNLHLAVDNEPEFLNEAEILGTEPDGLAGFLARNASFLIGEMWGQRDRRNTQDTEWKTTTMPWGAWIGGQPGDKNSPAWGFSRHPVGKDKAGASIVLGSSVGGARKAKAMDTMFAMGLDIDSGAKLDDVLDTVEEQGLLCFVYTSYNNGKQGIELKRDEVLRKLQITSDPTNAQVRQFLREFDKNRYEETFIAECSIKEQKHQTTEGVKIVLDTPPLEKFRLIFPLAEPVKIIDLAETHQAALDLWEDKITGLARNVLGVHFDTSCTDPSRLFYTARHPKGSDDWYAAIVMGEPLTFDSIQPMKKAAYTSNRDDNPFTQAGAETEGSRREYRTPSGASLNEWHSAGGKDRFMIADLLETLCPDKIRVAGGEAQGHVHIECPFEHEHTSEGGTATMAINCLDSQNEYWTIFCHHDACQGRNKLEFLEEMLRQGWFEESDLWDVSQGFLLEVEDSEDDPFEPVEAKEDRRAEVLGGLIAETEALDNESSDRAIRNLLTQAYTNFDVIGETGKAALLEAIAGATRLGVSKLKPMWKQTAKDHAAALVAEEARRRSKMKTPDYVPVSEATPESVSNAAATSKWLPSGFVHRDGWFALMRDDKPVRVAREFEVLYCADGKKGSTRTNEVTIRYQHRTSSLGIVESTFRIGDTYKDSGTILGRLRNEGLDFAPGAPTESVLTLLRGVDSDREAVYVERSGWLSGKVYVSPTGEVVQHRDDKRLYVLDHTMRVSNAKAGSLAMAVEAASAALRGRNAKRFLPGFLGGAVGCLADFLNEELAVIVANEGKAKHGKTTSLKAGISWFAVASAEGLLITGNVTPTAMEAKAVEASGAMFAPDEQGTSKATAADEQASALQYAGRIGRARGKTDGTLRDVNTWHGCMGMSTERGLLDRLEAEQAQDSSVDIRSGALSRIFTVSYDSAVKLDREEDAAELAAYNVLAHGGAYGWLGPVFAAKLIELGAEEVRGRVSALVSEWGKGWSGAAERVVRTAALFGVAAQIGQEAGLLPADVDLKAMLADLLTETLDQRAHHLDTERQAKDQLRRNIIRMVNRRQIVEIGHADEARGEIVGYWTSNSKADDLSARTYIIPVDRFGMLVKTEPSAMAEELRAEDALLLPSPKTKYYKRGFWENTPGESRKAPSVRVSGEWVHGNDLDGGEAA
ncbi:DUF927 domain-containing protein [Leisingera caerulea]|uniref:DUF927 domain-containing protein n=1 Tax=Leisingera caerulea TaxID=506591 RepID=UPI003F4AB8C3